MAKKKKKRKKAASRARGQAAKGSDQRVAEAVPQLVVRVRARTNRDKQLTPLIQELTRARRLNRLTLVKLSALTGMDTSAISKLETGRRANPTLETLMRYAAAVGKKLVVTLVDTDGA